MFYNISKDRKIKDPFLAKDICRFCYDAERSRNGLSHKKGTKIEKTKLKEFIKPEFDYFLVDWYYQNLGDRGLPNDVYMFLYNEMYELLHDKINNDFLGLFHIVPIKRGKFESFKEATWVLDVFEEGSFYLYETDAEIINQQNDVMRKIGIDEKFIINNQFISLFFNDWVFSKNRKQEWLRYKEIYEYTYVRSNLDFFESEIFLSESRLILLFPYKFLQFDIYQSTKQEKLKEYLTSNLVLNDYIDIYITPQNYKWCLKYQKCEHNSRTLYLQSKEEWRLK